MFILIIVIDGLLDVLFVELEELLLLLKSFPQLLTLTKFSIIEISFYWVDNLDGTLIFF